MHRLLLSHSSAAVARRRNQRRHWRLCSRRLLGTEVHAGQIRHGSNPSMRNRIGTTDASLVDCVHESKVSERLCGCGRWKERKIRMQKRWTTLRRGDQRWIGPWVSRGQGEWACSVVGRAQNRGLGSIPICARPQRRTRPRSLIEGPGRHHFAGVGATKGPNW